nr:phage tail protein [uncultured Sphingomonas sp.]
MKKADSLKALLLASVPALAADPAKLALFVDKGKVSAVRSQSLAFQLGYTLTIWVEEFAGDLDTLFVPVLAWVSQNQPELIGRPDSEPFTFESELLDGDRADITIEIELTERVLVEARSNGKLRTRHLDDAPTADVFAGAEQANLWQTVLDDQVAGTGPIPA